MDDLLTNDEREQLNALYDQQIFLLKKELDKMRTEKSQVLEKKAVQAAADPVVSAPVILAYSKAMANLYLKRREKRILEIACGEEMEVYERRLTAIRERLSRLEEDIKEMKKTV